MQFPRNFRELYALSTKEPNHQIRCTRISCPPFANIFIHSFLKKNKYMYICTYIYISTVILEEGMYERFNASCFFRHEKLCVFLEAPFLYLIPGNICSNFVLPFLFSFLFVLANPTRLRRSKKNDTTRRKIIFSYSSWTSVNALTMLFPSHSHFYTLFVEEFANCVADTIVEIQLLIRM